MEDRYNLSFPATFSPFRPSIRSFQENIMGSIKIDFLGHASFRFEVDGTIIYFDPWLDDNPVCSLKTADVQDADIVIVTHGHSDHVGDSFQVAKQTEATLVSNYEMCVVADTAGVPFEEQSVSLNPGGTGRVKNVEITLVPAHHSLSLGYGDVPEGHFFRPDSAVCGVVMAFNNGITVYNTSDTALFSDMQLIGQMYGPQIAILPVGGKYGMDIKAGVRAASYIRPEVVIPCHYDTFPNQRADIETMQMLAEHMCPNTAIAKVLPGQSLTYHSSRYEIG
jgi:L-ascorbate metabolism protein UlaG (beta-lactamase superfamily)